MEPVEIFIYVSAGLIVLSLLLGALADWSFLEGSKEMVGLLNDTPSPRFSVTRVGFLHEADAFWRGTCDYNVSNTTLVLHIQGTGLFTRTEFFDMVRDASWCDSFQSVSLGCGERENILMPDLRLPTVVTLNCTNATLRVS